MVRSLTGWENLRAICSSNPRRNSQSGASRTATSRRQTELMFARSPDSMAEAEAAEDQVRVIAKAAAIGECGAEAEGDKDDVDLGEEGVRERERASTKSEVFFSSSLRSS